MANCMVVAAPTSFQIKIMSASVLSNRVAKIPKNYWSFHRECLAGAFFEVVSVDGKCFRLRVAEINQLGLLEGGWREFCRAHSMNVGHSVTFSLISGTTMKATVFNQDGDQWPFNNIEESGHEDEHKALMLIESRDMVSEKSSRGQSLCVAWNSFTDDEINGGWRGFSIVMPKDVKTRATLEFPFEAAEFMMPYSGLKWAAFVDDDVIPLVILYDANRNCLAFGQGLRELQEHQIVRPEKTLHFEVHEGRDRMIYVSRQN